MNQALSRNDSQGLLQRWLLLSSVAFFRGLGGGSRAKPRAMDSLNARHAKGELTRDQCEQLKREMGGAGNWP